MTINHEYDRGDLSQFPRLTQRPSYLHAIINRTERYQIGVMCISSQARALGGLLTLRFYIPWCFGYPIEYNSRFEASHCTMNLNHIGTVEHAVVQRCQCVETASRRRRTDAMEWSTMIDRLGLSQALK